MYNKLETFGCWFDTKNCTSSLPQWVPNQNISPICGFSPALNIMQGIAPDGVRYFPPVYTLGSACSVDSDCTNPNGFTYCDAALGLCTKTPTTTSTTTTTTTAPHNPCSTGWFYYSATNACYRYINASLNGSQAQAEQYCANQGKKGHLISIHNEAEDDFVKSLIATGGDNVLIGYNNGTWTDATPVNYNNFPTAYCNNVCAALASPNYLWKSVDCNGPFKQFVCKLNV